MTCIHEELEEVKAEMARLARRKIRLESAWEHGLGLMKEFISKEIERIEVLEKAEAELEELGAE
ncbi:MAG: hypothetical protein LCH38_14900 [Proteobacteria bacterium]|nr:hypothetical protein [Pseudomonadota bacterium]